MANLPIHETPIPPRNEKGSARRDLDNILIDAFSRQLTLAWDEEEFAADVENSFRDYQALVGMIQENIQATIAQFTATSLSEGKTIEEVADVVKLLAEFSGLPAEFLRKPQK